LINLFQSNFELLDWLYSATGLPRTLSPVAFFHDGVSTSEIDLRFNLIGSKRRAQAIATAPRRKRYDDEENDDNEQKKSKKKLKLILIDFIRSSWLCKNTCCFHSRSRS
jgi:hypothetical protein